MAILQLWCLREPMLWTSLNSMRKQWPVLLDGWRPSKTNAHVERLADVIEIIMCALRGDEWFNKLHAEYPNVALSQLFSLFCSIGKLVHMLNARLSTQWLKHKRQHVRRFVSVTAQSLHTCG